MSTATVREIIAACAPRATPRCSTTPGNSTASIWQRSARSVGADEIAARLAAAADPEAVAALTFARDRIRAHHRGSGRRTTATPTRSGVELGSRWTAIEAVGLYVPGGTASYPSSVLMNARAGQGRRRRAHRHDGAGAGRRDQSAGAGRGRARRRVARSTGSAARRRSRRSPTAPRRSRRSPRSSGPATPMSRPPSGRCSARSAST